MAQTIIITGGSSGLGLETARTLAQDGDNHIILASRNPQDAAETLRNSTGNRNIISIPLNLGSLENVREFVAEVNGRDLPPLYGIVCNAGVSLAGETRYSADGHELTFAINHLGHFLLVNGLLSQLTRPGRVIMVSSGTHIPDHKLARRLGTPVPRYTTAHGLAMGDNAPEGERLSSQPLRYTTSKLCNVLFAYELARQIDDERIGVFAIDPGLMPDTNLAREFPAAVRAIFRSVISFFGRFTPDIRPSTQSAQDMKRLLMDEALTGRTALYFDGAHERPSAPDSYDLDKARDLWETSVELTT